MQRIQQDYDFGQKQCETICQLADYKRNEIEKNCYRIKGTLKHVLDQHEYSTSEDITQIKEEQRHESVKRSKMLMEALIPQQLRDFVQKNETDWEMEAE